jgi:hypothetical protein
VKASRFWQSEKQNAETISMEEARQIDRSDEQEANADIPRLEMTQPASNLADLIASHPWKHPFEIARISLGTISAHSFPKYHIAQVSLRSVRKSPQARKNGCSGSTVTLRIPEGPSTNELRSHRLAGIKTDSRE